MKKSPTSLFVCAAAGLLLSNSAFAVPVHYVIHFSNPGGVVTPQPPTGSFYYECAAGVCQFSSFTVSWAGIAFDFTSAANAGPQYPGGFTTCGSVPSPLSVFLLLSNVPLCAGTNLTYWGTVNTFMGPNSENFVFYDGQQTNLGPPAAIIAALGSSAGAPPNTVGGLFFITQEPPPLLYNTGVSDLCTLLPLGSVDPHWQLATPYPSAGSGTPLINPTNPLLPFDLVYANYADFGAPPALAWLPNGPSSEWLTPSATATHQEFGGQYVYRTTFRSAIPTITGQYSSDNELLAVYLNGVLISGFPLNGAADFNVWTGFAITGLSVV
jgi:hypothetical protein